MSMFERSDRRTSQTAPHDFRVDWDDVFMRELEAGATAPATRRCLKDVPALEGAMRPDQPLPIPVTLPVPTRQLAAAYNRAGGLLQRLARVTAIDVPTLLTVWFVETGGRVPDRDRLRIRFDLGRFYADWGARQAHAFGLYFRRGPRARDDQLRETAATPFRLLHRDPANEQTAFEIAMRLAGRALARRALCVGEAALPLAEHRALGYRSTGDMLRALERAPAQLIALFDLLRSGAARPDAPAAPGQLLELLRTHRFGEFAARAHDPDLAPAVARMLKSTYQRAVSLLAVEAAPPSYDPDVPDEPRAWDVQSSVITGGWPWPVPIRYWWRFPHHHDHWRPRPRPGHVAGFPRPRPPAHLPARPKPRGFFAHPPAHRSRSAARRREQ